MNTAMSNDEKIHLNVYIWTIKYYFDKSNSSVGK